MGLHGPRPGIIPKSLISIPTVNMMPIANVFNPIYHCERCTSHFYCILYDPIKYKLYLLAFGLEANLFLPSSHEFTAQSQ